jgi:hypothetical protein
MGRSREQEKIRELVSAYLDGELPPDDASYVGRQIQDDPAYAQVYASYRGIRMDMRSLSRPEVPPAVSQAIRARAAVMQPGRAVLSIRQRIARITAAAATLAATFAALLTGGFGLQNHFSHVTPGNGTSPTYVNVSTSSATTATILNPNIRYDEPAQILFTKPMNEQTVKTSVIFSPGVAVANLQYDKAQNILSTKPKTLLPQTQYTVTIPAGLKDAEGNDVQPNSFSFFVSNITPGIANQPTEPAVTVVPTPTPLVVAVAPTAVATPAPVTAPEVMATNVPPTTVEQPAATDLPAAPTATPKPAPPKPTNTPVPAPKPQGTTVAVTEPTAVPTVAPTATTAPTTAPAPTVAPTATAAPTLAPTPTTPAIAVADRFKGAYAALANRLGTPTGPAGNVATSQLFFQNGFMLYVAGQPIYVFDTSSRTWTSYGNPGNAGAGSDGGPGPSAGLFKPARAFGVVWTAQNLQSRLGYATAANESGGSGTIQTFENGTILSVGSDVYVLLKNGTWQPFSG